MPCTRPAAACWEATLHPNPAVGNLPALDRVDVEGVQPQVIGRQGRQQAGVGLVAGLVGTRRAQHLGGQVAQRAQRGAGALAHAGTHSRARRVALGGGQVVVGGAHGAAQHRPALGARLCALTAALAGTALAGAGALQPAAGWAGGGDREHVSADVVGGRLIATCTLVGYGREPAAARATSKCQDGQQLELHSMAVTGARRCTAPNALSFPLLRGRWEAVPSHHPL